MATDHNGEYIKIPGITPTNFIGKLPKIAQRANYLSNFSAVGQTPTASFADAVGNILRLVTNAAQICLANYNAASGSVPVACGVNGVTSIQSRWAGGAGPNGFFWRGCSGIFNPTSASLAPSDYATNALYGQLGGGSVAEASLGVSGVNSVRRCKMLLYAERWGNANPLLVDQGLERWLSPGANVTGAGANSDNYIGNTKFVGEPPLSGGQPPGVLIKIPNPVRFVTRSNGGGGAGTSWTLNYKVSLVMLTFPGGITASPTVTVLATSSARSDAVTPGTGINLGSSGGVAYWSHTFTNDLPANFFLPESSFPGVGYLLALTLTDWSLTWPTSSGGSPSQLFVDCGGLSQYSAWDYPGYAGAYQPGDVVGYPSCVTE